MKDVVELYYDYGIQMGISLDSFKELVKEIQRK